MCDAKIDSAETDGRSGSSASRRAVLRTALAVAGAAILATGTPAHAARAASAPSGDHLLLLDLGGPVVGPGQAKPALALVVGGRVYLVDCGLVTARQLVSCGLGYAAVHNVFLTHQHFDHTSGLPGLVLHGWTATQASLTSLDLWGPPGMQRMPAGVRTTIAEEIRLFDTGGGFGEFPRLRGHEVFLPSPGGIRRVMEDDNVVVDATRVFHGPEVRNAYAYRFTIKRTGKVVVFSGDTAAPDQNLIGLAKGCDMLVHECQDNSIVDRIAGTLPKEQGEALRKYLYEAHSSVLDLSGVAKAANAKRLVLNHYTPVVHPADTWMSLIRPAAESAGYHGEIVAPMDLESVPL